MKPPMRQPSWTPPPLGKSPPLPSPLPNHPPPKLPRPGNPGPVTLSRCGVPNGCGHREQTRKEGSGSQGGLWLLQVAQYTALRGGGGRGLIALSCPMMPARLPVDRWDLQHCPAGIPSAGFAPSSPPPTSPLFSAPGCPVAYGTHSALPLVELPLGEKPGGVAWGAAEQERHPDTVRVH